jgi:hypothetical protein
MSDPARRASTPGVTRGKVPGRARSAAQGARGHGEGRADEAAVVEAAGVVGRLIAAGDRRPDGHAEIDALSSAAIRRRHHSRGTAGWGEQLRRIK